MFQPSRSALLVATLSLAGGALMAPGSAQAAGTTQLSATQMVAALKPVSTASTAAAKDGWRAAITATGALSGSASFVVDTAHGVAYEQYRLGGINETIYVAAGRGLYGLLPDAESRATVKMMGRPTVRYVFAPDKSLTLAKHFKDGTPTPAAVLSDDVDHPGRKIVHDDGSTDFVQVVDGSTVTMQVSPDGTLAGAHIRQGGDKLDLTYTYAPQHVTLPAATTVISAAALATGVWYLHMPADVRQVSYSGAAAARRAAHSSTVKVASVRKLVRREVSAFNKKAQLNIIKVKDVSGGVRVYSTNPWTHQTVAYTVKASKKKVIVTH